MAQAPSGRRSPAHRAAVHKRGAYAKGVAKREEILERALEVIAREGLRGASVRELAEAVGLSQAGLLHYFESKEELFTEILRKRDEIDAADYDLDVGDAEATHSLADVRRGYVGVIGHNAEVPGLVQLFARVSVDAADPSHPAHDLLIARGAQLRRLLADAVAREQAAGAVRADVPPDTLARIFQAVADGLQVQWMLEPGVDMAATVDALFTLLAPSPVHAPTPAPTPTPTPTPTPKDADGEAR